MRRGAAGAALAVAAAGCLVLAGCGSPGGGSGGGSGGSGGGDGSSAASSRGASASASGTLTVFAAASLQKTFTDLGKRFEAAHPGVRVTFSFAGSSDLAAQIAQGAPADVFASADEANMAKTTGAGLAQGTPVDFATNVLTIVTPPGDPGRVTSFADLARSGLDVVVCAPQVPCGAAAEEVEAATGTRLHPVSEESSVTDVLTKVESGEADAGLVYVTDAEGAGSRVRAVPFPESGGAVNTYPITALRGAAQPRLAQEFVQLVTGPQGRGVLSAAGFGAP